MKSMCSALAFLLLASPVMADIVSNESDATAKKNPAQSRAVKSQLLTLGVDATEADRIVKNLREEDLAYFSANPKANAVVGQQEIVTLFWYEWVLGIAYMYSTWRFWDTWGCKAFFPELNCD